MSYTVSMISGHLPEIDDPLPGTDPRFPILGTNMGPDGQPPPRRGPYFFVANHPPLFYAVAAGPVRLAAESSDDVAPALTLRVLNALFMGLGVALTGWAAAKMFPGRGRQVTVVAAGVAAVLPVVVGNAALGYNDGLALALNAGSLGVMALLLRGGPSRRLVVAATALAAACLLTRASLLPVVAGLAAAALLGAWRRDWRRWPGQRGGVVGHDRGRRRPGRRLVLRPQHRAVRRRDRRLVPPPSARPRAARVGELGPPDRRAPRDHVEAGLRPRSRPAPRASARPAGGAGGPRRRVGGCGGRGVSVVVAPAKAGRCRAGGLPGRVAARTGSGSAPSSSWGSPP